MTQTTAHQVDERDPSHMEHVAAVHSAHCLINADQDASSSAAVYANAGDARGFKWADMPSLQLPMGADREGHPTDAQINQALAAVSHAVVRGGFLQQVIDKVKSMEECIRARVVEDNRWMSHMQPTWDDCCMSCGGHMALRAYLHPTTSTLPLGKGKLAKCCACMSCAARDGWEFDVHVKLVHKLQNLTQLQAMLQVLVDGGVQLFPDVSGIVGKQQVHIIGNIFQGGEPMGSWGLTYAEVKTFLTMTGGEVGGGSRTCWAHLQGVQ